MREDFEHWWEKEGQHSELCGKDLCIIAWSNGKYKAFKELTDEEIEGVAMANVDGHSSMEQLKWFARAILIKAQQNE
jgi:hypothetical protein